MNKFDKLEKLAGNKYVMSKPAIVQNKPLGLGNRPPPKPIALSAGLQSMLNKTSALGGMLAKPSQSAHV